MVDWHTHFWLDVEKAPHLYHIIIVDPKILKKGLEPTILGCLHKFCYPYETCEYLMNIMMDPGVPFVLPIPDKRCQDFPKVILEGL